MITIFWSEQDGARVQINDTPETISMDKEAGIEHEVVPTESAPAAVQFLEVTGTPNFEHPFYDITRLIL